jgi:two-component system invasion response regulator UvrY
MDYKHAMRTEAPGVRRQPDNRPRDRNAPMKRILIVDDHPVVREGVREILTGVPEIELVSTASDADVALAQLETGGYSLVLLDLSLPGSRSGLELLIEIKHRFPNVPVLILSMHAERHLVLHTLRAGAAGYVTKDSAPDELISAIRRITAGGRYVTSSLAETLVTELQAIGEKPLHEGLSEREFEVLCHIAAGKSLKMIAAQLKLGETTVSTYRSRILEKLHVQTNADIVRYALLHSLVE